MPELRKDPINGRWVIVASERARRPGNLIDREDNGPREEDSPFVRGSESKTPPEIYAVRKQGSKPNDPNWQVRVVPSIEPILGIEGKLNQHGYGLYDVMNGIGAHEIIIETPKKIANMADLDVKQIELVLKTYAVRIKDLTNDDRFKYILVYKNYGWSAGGGRIGHSRSQLIATPVNPIRVEDELKGVKNFGEYHDRCIYCDLMRQECESKKRIVSENKNFVAFTPFASRFPFEMWILPKKHSSDFAVGISGLEADLARILKEVLLRLKIGLDDPAYNYVIHSLPLCPTKSQKTQHRGTPKDYHWHIEVMPRLTHIAGFEKGTGFYICPIPPEYTAEFLREVEI